MLHRGSNLLDFIGFMYMKKVKNYLKNKVDLNFKDIQNNNKI